MIHYHVLADVAAEHRSARVAEGAARRLARQARHTSRQHRTRTATQRTDRFRSTSHVSRRCTRRAQG